MSANDQDEAKALELVTIQDRNAEHPKAECYIYKPAGLGAKPPRGPPAVEQTIYADLPKKLYEKTIELIEYKCREKQKKD